MTGPLFIPRTIYGLGLPLPMSDLPLPPPLTTERISEARLHLARAKNALLTIWPNGGATHMHAAEAFDGITKAIEALS